MLAEYGVLAHEHQLGLALLMLASQQHLDFARQQHLELVLQLDVAIASATDGYDLKYASHASANNPEIRNRCHASHVWGSSVFLIRQLALATHAARPNERILVVAFRKDLFNGVGNQSGGMRLAQLHRVGDSSHAARHTAAALTDLLLSVPLEDL